MTVVYDVEPPTIAITSFATKHLVDTIEISITDTLSPIAIDAGNMKDFIAFNALGFNNLVPMRSVGFRFNF